MSIKDHALLVSLVVNKPQMTAKDPKATRDAERANDAHGAGQFRKDLYPKGLIQPILTVESSARAYIERTTYPWARGENLLPVARFMKFTERMRLFEIEFNQTVTAFLNNWSNVMQVAQATQGDLFNPSEYPDLSSLRAGFRMRVVYKPVTDMADFRVALQASEIEALKKQVEDETKESMNALLREPLMRLREVVDRLREATGKEDRVVKNARSGKVETKAPIFRDSIVENIEEEISLLRDMASLMPPNIVALANTIESDLTVPPNVLRASSSARRTVHSASRTLLSEIDAMLNGVTTSAAPEEPPGEEEPAPDAEPIQVVPTGLNAALDQMLRG